MPAINFNFTSNNVKGLKITKKRIKSFEYFKSKLALSVTLFGRESKLGKQNRKDELNGQIFFTCCIFIAFLGSKSVTTTKEISDNSGRILVYQVKTDDEIYLLVKLVNLYNSNTEPEQVETLPELDTFLLKLDAK